MHNRPPGAPFFALFAKGGIKNCQNQTFDLPTVRKRADDGRPEVGNDSVLFGPVRLIECTPRVCLQDNGDLVATGEPGVRPRMLGVTHYIR